MTAPGQPVTWRKSLKRALLGAANLTGGFRWLERARWRNQRLLILGYHGISQADEHHWDGELFISPSQLESRLILLRERYCVLGLDEALERLAKKDLPPNSVAITFDDGFYSTYKTAWPLLRKHGIPFSVYLTTYHCDNQLPIFRLACSFLLWKSRGTVAAPFDALGSMIAMDLREKSGRDAALLAIENAAQSRRLSAIAKDELAAALAGHLGIDYEDFKSRRLLHLMTPSEIASMAAGGVQFGLHTHRHRLPAGALQFGRELDENEDRIRLWTGQTPRHFCYPGGAHRADLVAWLAQRKIKSAATCEPGLAARGNDPLLLPRVIDHSFLSPIEYQGWLSGVGHFIPRWGGH